MAKMIALILSFGLNVILMNMLLEEKHELWQFKNKYYKDSIYYYRNACRHGSYYPDDWRNYQGNGWNVRSRHTWCEEGLKKIESYIWEESTRIGE